MRPVSFQELLQLLLLRKLQTCPLSALPPPLSHPRVLIQPSAPSPLRVSCLHSLPLPPAAKIMLWNPDQNMFLLCCVLFVAQLCHPITPLLFPLPPPERPRPPIALQILCHFQGFAPVWHAAWNAVPRGLTLLLCLPSELQSSPSLTQMPHPREPSWPSLLVTWHYLLSYLGLLDPFLSSTNQSGIPLLRGPPTPPPFTTYLSRPPGISVSVEDRDNLLANGPIPLYWATGSLWPACEWASLGPVATSVLRRGTQGLCCLL